ncbi:phosphodiester glycosidase family protein [Synechococcus sp. HK05]|uniref:phosphodiester glycosidase family protein n=1 Tax=Synechococcus sp. HK05 TaxID=2725975 RepID=UPI001C38354D|nr:phosphodiester glycosidase family protein [Synechococcus sp. HK05]MBV2352718.1 phosphodiester glycosidase family protein [Synechococcus sp. HK05]
MPPLPALAALLPGIPLTPPPPLPAPPPQAPLQRQAKPAGRQGVSGTSLSINGLRQQALWLDDAGELWLPLEVLEGQLGVSRSAAAGGSLALEWFGQTLKLSADQQRSLDDEVAVPVGSLLEAVGVKVRRQGRELQLELPSRPLQAIRTSKPSISGQRVVLDLSAPALVRSGDGQLLIGAEATAAQLEQLKQLGLKPNQRQGWLSVQVPREGERLSLGTPWRLVLDLPQAAGQGIATTPTPAPERDPRLVALQKQGLQLERRIGRIGSRQVLINSVRLDPRQVPLELRPLNRSDGMQGLSSLSQLARQEQALIAINGGYFNRVNRLPLGAMREQGRWLSGPILNRGAAGWTAGELPRFDRLMLVETIEDSNRQRWTVSSVNSGYVQKGLARYTADWGSRYQPITGTEMGVLVRQGVVQQRFELGELRPGVPLRNGDLLLVARGGVNVPWQTGEPLTLKSRASSAVGDQPNVLGGGPLLLQNGRVVLNGSAEGFSSGFMAQGAPRTVVGSDGRQLWLITLQGVNNPGPTLMETALLMRQEGLKDALNLDGGSSTGLVLADVHTVKGRGVAAAVHNGLGLVPKLEQARTPERP